MLSYYLKSKSFSRRLFSALQIMPNCYKGNLPTRSETSFSLTRKRAMYSIPPGKSQESLQAEQKSWSKTAQKQLLRNYEHVARSRPSCGGVPRAQTPAQGCTVPWDKAFGPGHNRNPAGMEGTAKARVKKLCWGTGAREAVWRSWKRSCASCARELSMINRTRLILFHLLTLPRC